MKCDPHAISSFSNSYAVEREEFATTIDIYPRLARVTQVVNRVQTAILVRVGLNHSRWAILKLLNESGSSLRCSDLADRVGVSRATITGVLDTLEKAFLIVRVPDPHDRRAFSVKITSLGEEILMEIHRNLNLWAGELLNSFASEEASQLEALFGRLEEVLEESSSDILEASRSSVPV